MILESFTNTPHKTIHVVYINDDLESNHTPIWLNVGRDNNVNIRITDISVSRLHAKITYIDNEFYISDWNSKFGTLVLLQTPFSIPYIMNYSFSVQLGKYLITISPEIFESNCLNPPKLK